MSLAEGYRKARADMIRPGDAVVAELDRQLAPGHGGQESRPALGWPTIRHVASDEEVWFDTTVTHS